MQQLMIYLSRYGAWLVFASTLVEQIGIPIPAYPVLILAGALIARGDLSAPGVLLAALVASLLGDSVWYVLGRRYGYRILKTLCRISLSPDSCVRQTEGIFKRWGMGSLVVSKFIPGFSTVAPPLAGATRVKPKAFLAYDALGIFLWVGSALALGFIFHRAIERVIGLLEALGKGSLVLMGIALALFIVFKWWERRRFYIALRMARISVEELRRLVMDEKEPFIVDVRTEVARQADRRRIPGAMILELSEIDQKLTLLPHDREIVVYCT